MKPEQKDKRNDYRQEYEVERRTQIEDDERFRMFRHEQRQLLLKLKYQEEELERREKAMKNRKRSNVK